MEAAKLVSEEDAPYTFRPYKLSDIPFIQSSWGLSYYSGCQGYQILNPEQFHAHHRPIREKILNRPNIAIIVACANDDEDLIIGYIIVEKPDAHCIILHYIYVKQAFKSEGIGKELISRACTERPVLYTHQTIQALKVINKFKNRGSEDFDRFHFTPHLA